MNQKRVSAVLVSNQLGYLAVNGERSQPKWMSSGDMPDLPDWNANSWRWRRYGDNWSDWFERLEIDETPVEEMSQ